MKEISKEEIKKEKPIEKKQEEIKEKKIEKPKAGEEIKEKVKIKEVRPGKEIIGIAKIYSTYNNTIIHIVDNAGNTIAKASGGQVTKYDRLEASPTVAMFVAKKVAAEAKEKGVTSLHVRIRAKGGHAGPHMPGPGSQAALKSFSRAGIRIKSIVDVTPVAYGGCRPPHGRRGRRV